MRILDGLRVKVKLAILLGLFCISLIVAVGVAASIMHQRMMADRVAELRNIVEVASGLAQALEDDVKAGKMTREQALDRFRADIHKMWYNNHHAYIFAATEQGIFIVNAGNPKVEGTRGTIDAHGRTVFSYTQDKAKTEDEGTAPYLYPKPGTTKPLLKLSYFKKFAPWGAIISTGVWADDIEADYDALLWKLGGLVLVIMGVVAIIAYLINRNITGSLGSLRGKMAALAAGDLAVDVTETARGDAWSPE